MSRLKGSEKSWKTSPSESEAASSRSSVSGLDQSDDRNFETPHCSSSSLEVDEDERRRHWLYEQMKLVHGDSARQLDPSLIRRDGRETMPADVTLQPVTMSPDRCRDSRTRHLRKKLPPLSIRSSTTSSQVPSQPSTVGSSLRSSSSAGWWTPKRERRKLQKPASSRHHRNTLAPTTAQPSQYELMEAYEDLRQEALHWKRAGRDVDDDCPAHAGPNGEPYCPNCIGRIQAREEVEVGEPSLDSVVEAPSLQFSRPASSRPSSTRSVSSPATDLPSAETELGGKKSFTIPVPATVASPETEQIQSIAASFPPTEWSTIDSEFSSTHSDQSSQAPSTPRTFQPVFGGLVRSDQIHIPQPLRRSSTRRRLIDFGKKLATRGPRKGRRWWSWSRWKKRSSR